MAVSYEVLAAAALVSLLAGSTTPAAAFQPSNNPKTVSITPRVKENPRPEGSAPETFLRMDASMVLVPVQVSTREGAPVTNLKETDFRVYEDGDLQDISYFVRDDAPISIGILLDSSASMQKKKRQAAEAAAALLRTANSQDEFFLIQFDEGPRLSVPFTQDLDEINDEVRHMKPWGRTSLFDAIHMAIEQMKRARHERKALVILSDGGDNRSRRTYTKIKDEVLEADLTLYAMGVFDPAGTTPETPEEIKGPDLLEDLVNLTGGHHFPVSTAELPGIAAKIGTLLRSQYLLGYYPQNVARDGTYRSIKLELDAPMESPAYIRYRTGYRAPGR